MIYQKPAAVARESRYYDTEAFWGKNWGCEQNQEHKGWHIVFKIILSHAPWRDNIFIVPVVHIVNNDIYNVPQWWVIDIQDILRM